MTFRAAGGAGEGGGASSGFRVAGGVNAAQCTRRRGRDDAIGITRSR